jgi:hypothetical protein
VSDVTIFPAPLPPAFCGAKTKEGGKCRRAPVPGADRCYYHGGASFTVQQAIQQKRDSAILALLGEGPAEAVKALVSIVTQFNRETCPTCGLPSGDAMPTIRAATAILDRIGLGANANLTVRHEVAEPPAPVHEAEWMPNWQLGFIRKWLAEARERMERREPAADWSASYEPPADAIDATVIESHNVEPARQESD